MEETKDSTVKIILLDAPGEVNAYRLNKINSAKKIKVGLEQTVSSVDELIKSSSDFAHVLRDICIKSCVPVINTVSKTPDEVATEIKKLLK
jgi:hypothetical protein